MILRGPSILGQAFLEQQKELMDTIQMLRAKAQSLGTLKTTPQQVVVVTNYVVADQHRAASGHVTNTVVQIQPANPQVIYVPTYDPCISIIRRPFIMSGRHRWSRSRSGITVGSDHRQQLRLASRRHLCGPSRRGRLGRRQLSRSRQCERQREPERQHQQHHD